MGREVLNLIRELITSGMTMILATPKVVDLMMLFDEDVIVEEGSTEQIFEVPSRECFGIFGSY